MIVRLNLTAERSCRKAKTNAVPRGVHDPGRNVRADIRLDIRKIKDGLVELSLQPRISTVNRAPIYV